jgi:hypothetical protein
MWMIRLGFLCSFVFSAVYVFPFGVYGFVGDPICEGAVFVGTAGRLICKGIYTLYKFEQFSRGKKLKVNGIIQGKNINIVI